MNQVTRLEAEEATPYVGDALRRLRAEVGNQAAVLGFVGAPFTLASYIVEGGSSKNYTHIKRLAFSQPDVLHALLKKLADNIADYVRYQASNLTSSKAYNERTVSLERASIVLMCTFHILNLWSLQVALMEGGMRGVFKRIGAHRSIAGKELHAVCTDVVLCCMLWRVSQKFRKCMSPIECCDQLETLQPA